MTPTLGSRDERRATHGERGMNAGRKPRRCRAHRTYPPDEAPTIKDVDTSAGMMIAGAIGGVVGAMVTYLWRFSERREQTVIETSPVVPPGAELVLSVLSSSA